MELDESYSGREHSYIKHELLKGYLKKLMLIKAMSGTKELVYVDCFAGPWADDSQDMHATSIAISLDILTEVREYLAAAHKKYDIKFRAIYVEKSKKRYLRLQQYLQERTSRVTATAIHGDYSKNLETILRECNEAFSFFFIDPKGWESVGVPKLAPLLSRQNSEFMITFMYDFLNRAIGMEKMRDQVCSLLGPLSEEDLENLSGRDDRENVVVRRYQELLKVAMSADAARKPHAYHATILDKDKERTKYHLVYLSRHERGIVEFANISDKMGIVQRRVRFDKKTATSGQSDMFGLGDSDIENGANVSLSEVKSYWMRQLQPQPTPYGLDKLADMLEETGWYEKDLQRAFNELLVEKKVENLDMKRRRPTSPVQFKELDRLRRLI